MFCDYFHFLKGSTQPASQRHGDTGPSTPVACAADNSDATKRRSEAKKVRPKTEALDETRGQLMKRVIAGSAVTSCLLVATPSLAAADNALFSSDDGNFVVFGGLGLANIKAQEFVYYGDRKRSQLNWESKGMTLFTVGVDAQIDNDWSLKGSVEIGTGHMVAGATAQSIPLPLPNSITMSPERSSWTGSSTTTRPAVSRSAPVSNIPTSSGPPMAGPASIRPRVASETTPGRIQTG
ncbi:hypothetical protein U5G49_007390 (plasmid) [Rhizobium indigoferae]|uniref:Omptin family outer membrane protease n=1 Tax=Rhizobium indigoferae TaxID=158891 RepID=A0ABZ1DNG4_9HYPH|nr:hypothetical protein [Rhizobium indigoferae]WRW37754.1 hypothetical protein U5G49_007390 [Rhizobium indigoferae]